MDSDHFLRLANRARYFELRAETDLERAYWRLRAQMYLDAFWIAVMGRSSYRQMIGRTVRGLA